MGAEAVAAEAADDAAVGAAGVVDGVGTESGGAGSGAAGVAESGGDAVAESGGETVAESGGDVMSGSGGDTDPWLALDESGASPARVDAIARERIGRFALDDVRRSAGLTSWLVRRAAADGSTVLDGSSWAAALRGYGIDVARPGLDAAAAAGRVVVLPSERAITHPTWGRLEEQIADDLHALMASGGPDEAPSDPVEAALAMPVCLVVAGPGSGADAWIGALRRHAMAAGRLLTVVDEAHRLDLAGGAEILESHDMEASLVLVGDPDQLEPLGPGRFFGDLVASGVVPTVRLPEAAGAGGNEGRAGAGGDGADVDRARAGSGTTGDAGGSGGADAAVATAATATADADATAAATSATAGSAVAAVAAAGPIVRLVESLRSGELPPVEPGQHAVVVSPVADAGQAVARVVELVTDALPRVTGVGPSDLLVLGIRSAGAAGVEALREAVGAGGGASDIDVAAVHEAVGRRAEAVVLALPAESAGSLTRAHLITAAAVARRHLSIVHQAGPALAEAVRRRPHRPRRTRLAALLRT